MGYRVFSVLLSFQLAISLFEWGLPSTLSCKVLEIDSWVRQQSGYNGGEVGRKGETSRRTHEVSIYCLSWRCIHSICHLNLLSGVQPYPPATSRRCYSRTGQSIFLFSFSFSFLFFFNQPTSEKSWTFLSNATSVLDYCIMSSIGYAWIQPRKQTHCSGVVKCVHNCGVQGYALHPWGCLGSVKGVVVIFNYKFLGPCCLREIFLPMWR